VRDLVAVADQRFADEHGHSEFSVEGCGTAETVGNIGTADPPNGNGKPPTAPLLRIILFIPSIPSGDPPMRFALAFLGLTLVPLAAPAQTARFELGQRLRAFEDAWETADAAGKERALKIVPKVTNQFFSFQLGEAGRTLDDARHALTSAKPRTAAQQWADSLYAEPETRLIDAGEKELKVTIRAFYPVKAKQPKELAVRLKLGRAEPKEVALDALPTTVMLDPAAAAGGSDFADLTLTTEARARDKSLTTRTLGVSRLAGAAGGFPVVEKYLARGKKSLPDDSLELATLTDRVALLKELANGTVTETNYPAAKLLREALEMATSGGSADGTTAKLAARVRALKDERESGRFVVPPDVLEQALANHPKVAAKQKRLDELAKEFKELQKQLMPGAPLLDRAETNYRKALAAVAGERTAAKKELLPELQKGRKQAVEDELKKAEADLAAAPKPKGEEKPFFNADRAGQFWLTVPTGKARTACRLLVPKGLDAKKPVPLVVALHGAGGSENLFFEGYGAGHVVTLCEKRGWLLVAPRLGLSFVGGPVPLGEIVDKLAERYPIDPTAVFVVGHSMGASATIAAAQKYPGKFAAVAALGGGGRVKADTAKAFAELPTFVGVGSADFALTGARSLNKALVDAGAKKRTFKEYDGVEHLLIVREALGDVFAVFDKAARK